MTTTFSLLERSLPPLGPLVTTAPGDGSPALKSALLLDGVLWLDGADLGPVLCETPPPLGIGKPSTTNLLEIVLDRSSLTLIETNGKRFVPAAVPAAQALRRKLLTHLQAALDGLALPPGPRIDGPLHSGSLPALDWPTFLTPSGRHSQHRDRSRALMAVQEVAAVAPEPDPPGLDPRLHRWLDWIAAIPRLDETALQLWHRQDGREVVLRLTTPKPPALVTGARVPQDRPGGIVIEDLPKPASTHAPSLYALRRLITLARCFESVWHGPKPQLAIELVFTDVPVSQGFRLELGRDLWGMPLARLALGRATKTEIEGIFHGFEVT